MKNRRPVSNKLEIVMYMHCGRCLKERPPEQSPNEWSQIDVGWTERGFQVWCKRHQVNVCHVDFEGVQHPANTTADFGN